jgi:hypothetical protein
MAMTCAINHRQNVRRIWSTTCIPALLLMVLGASPGANLQPPATTSPFSIDMCQKDKSPEALFPPYLRGGGTKHMMFWAEGNPLHFISLLLIQEITQQSNMFSLGEDGRREDKLIKKVF